jgi:hypothetical protein
MKDELVTSVTMPRHMVETAFPTAAAEFQKYSQTIVFRMSEVSLLIELRLAHEYNTHWELLSGKTRDRKIIKIQFLEDSTNTSLEETDIVIVLADYETEEEKVGRILTSDSHFFEIRSKRELLPLLVNIVDTYNKAHLKKIPTTVNTYKAEKVKMVEEDENLPLNSFMASMLRNVPGVSEDVAKALTRQYRTIDNLMANLAQLEDFKFQASSGTSRALQRPVVERLCALFAADAKGSEIIFVTADLALSCFFVS